MAGEVTIPLLPCAAIDEIEEFYEALGFRRTYRQTKPNPYVVVRREDWELHFFGIDGFDPENSYGSCVVQVPDIGVVHAAFTEGPIRHQPPTTSSGSTPNSPPPARTTAEAGFRSAPRPPTFEEGLERVSDVC